MARTRNRRAPAPRYDLGPKGRGGVLMLANHGDVAIRDEPTEGRRARREYIHERLWRSGRIGEPEYQAAEIWARDHALVSGAHLEPASLLSTGGAGLGPSARVIAAAARIRTGAEAIGPTWTVMVRLACCEGYSTTRMALTMIGNDSRRARGRIDDAIADALAALASAIGA